MSHRYARRCPLLAAAVVLSLALVLAAAELRALLILAVVFAAGWLARGRFRPAARAPARPVLRVADDRDRLAAELDDARQSIAKLEQNAAANDELFGTLERVAGRPVEVIIADYRRVQRQYGPGRGRQGREAAMTNERGLAARTVRGVVAGMVTATAAATVVGFWLSYAGLHTFAARAGLTGPESWAWPASVDLFIAAGEAGVTISALRRRRDPLAWIYLGLGFATSVAGNVLQVDTGHLPWARYAVAAVPPMAAMLALAALLRHVYQLTLEAHLADTPDPAPGTVPADVLAAAETSLRATVAAGNPLSQNQLIERFRLTAAPPRHADHRPP